MHLLAIGDLNLDLVIDLTDGRQGDIFADLTSSTNLFAPVNALVGGAGLQLAAAARNAGFDRTTLIGMIGAATGSADKPDIAGQTLLDELDRLGVDRMVSVTSGTPTGRTVIMYLPQGRRLMISDPGANATFSLADLSEPIRSAAKQADVLHISAYALLAPARRQAVIELIRIARTSKRKRPLVAIDVVPHDIYRRMEVDDLFSTLSLIADLIFVEFKTARRLLGLEPVISAPKEEELLSVLRALARFAPTVMMQVDSDTAIEYQEGIHRFRSMPCPTGVASRGAGATAQASALYDRQLRS